MAFVSGNFNFLKQVGVAGSRSVTLPVRGSLHLWGPLHVPVKGRGWDSRL